LGNKNAEKIAVGDPVKGITATLVTREEGGAKKGKAFIARAARKGKKHGKTKKLN